MAQTNRSDAHNDLAPNNPHRAFDGRDCHQKGNLKLNLRLWCLLLTTDRHSFLLKTHQTLRTGFDAFSFWLLLIEDPIMPQRLTAFCTFLVFCLHATTSLILLLARHQSNSLTTTLEGMRTISRYSPFTKL
jgi:hypothetical protein